MYVTIGEEIMLLSLDDHTGAVKQRHGASWAVAGGALLELVLAERIGIDGRKLLLLHPAPTGVPLLDTKLTYLASRPRHPDLFAPRVDRWIVRERRSSVREACHSLAVRGVVRELRFQAARRYPQVDRTVEQLLRARLARVVLNGEQPDARTCGLIALLHSSQLHRIAFPYLSPAEVKPRMERISQGEWAGDVVRQAIRAAAAAAASAGF